MCVLQQKEVMLNHKDRDGPTEGVDLDQGFRASTLLPRAFKVI